MREPIATRAGAQPAGPYSQGIVATGRMLCLAARGPIDPATQESVLGHLESQATLILQDVRSVVEAAGATLPSAVRVGVFLADMKDFEVMDAVYERFFPEPRPRPDDRPSRPWRAGTDRGRHRGARRMNGTREMAVEPIELQFQVSQGRQSP